MISITAENTKNLPMNVAPKIQTWDKRNRAAAAAVKAIGPHARDGFEFTVEKCDGRWLWRATDGSRPESAAQIKANGGKKSLLAQAVAIEAKGGTAPKELLEKAFDEVAGEIAAKAALGTSGNPTAAQKLMLEDGVPEFLVFRLPLETKEQQEARAKKYEKTTGPGRQIKNPPNIKDAKKRAAKEKGKNIGFTAREAILAGKTNEEALAVVMKAHPTCGSNIGCMSWYRNDLRKKGLLKNDPQPKPRPTKKTAKK